MVIWLLSFVECILRGFDFDVLNLHIYAVVDSEP
jgi:hypothetical protein